MTETSVKKPDIRIRKFEGPLDLLFHLIEKNEFDIYDIPISEITRQYMEFLDAMQKLDMEIASDFLVMAATLVHIKSRMMLPGRRKDSDDAEEDPREELVISLLRYKRCKLLAGELKERNAKYTNCRYRVAMTAKELGIEVKAPPQEFEPEEWDIAVENVCKRNEVRFADISAKITHILKKDKLSIKERVKSMWDVIARRGRMFFHDFFKKGETDKMDRVVGFLAVLELLRSNKITAEQKKPFDAILIEKKGFGDSK